MSACARALAFSAILIFSSARAAPTQTESGLVEGAEESGIVIFKGIPFAAPPIGELRWRDPQPVTPWQGVKRADRFSPTCMQQGSYPPDSPPETASEDCLYLNVWAPADAKTGSLPVMVWIYGGGWVNGSASTPLYAGDVLARKDVVVVTLNYRLGVFGFLAHPELTKESGHGSSGAYGWLDQIAALRWVQRNISAFGGDPQRVTVFGQSTGAISISALTASPLARGLFQRAIAQSGGLFEPLELSPDNLLKGAETLGSKFATSAGAASIEALRSMPASALMRIPFYGAGPIVDGYVLTRPPYDTYRAGQQNEVAILAGSNAEEGRLFLDGRDISVDNYSDQLEHDFPGFLVALLAPKPGATNESARAAFIDFEGDMRFRWDMWAWARAAAGNHQPFFLYEFSPGSPSGEGASHGAEMPYVFGHLAGNRSTDLANAMIGYWTNFAKTGDPNGPGLAEWPAFSVPDARLMRLGDVVRADAVPRVAALERIDRVYASAGWLLHHGTLIVGITVAVLATGLFWGLRSLARRLGR